MFKKSVLAIVCTLVLSAASWAANLTLPAEVKGDVGEWVVVKAVTDSKHPVKWMPITPGLKLFPVELLKDSQNVAVTANTPGSYKLLAYTGDETGPSDPAIVTVVIGASPGPGPAPGPTPQPDDSFVKSLQTALDVESVTDKAKVKSLAALYRQASTNTVSQTNLKTVSDLKAVTSTAINNLVGSTSLTKVRRAIANELNKVLPTEPDAPMSDATRKLCTDQYERVAKALEALR